MTTTLSRLIGKNNNEFDHLDLFFKNFFDPENFFLPFNDSVKVMYPVDTYITNNKLFFEIAAVGLEKEDINIETYSNILHVFYDKEREDNKLKHDESYKDYIHKGITRKSFDFGWKISDQYDLQSIDANMKNGLLSISISKLPEKETIKKNIEIK